MLKSEIMEEGKGAYGIHDGVKSAGTQELGCGSSGVRGTSGAREIRCAQVKCSRDQVCGAREVHESRRHEESGTRGPQMRFFLTTITSDLLTTLLCDNVEIRGMSCVDSL